VNDQQAGASSCVLLQAHTDAKPQIHEGPTLQYTRLVTIILTQISKTTMYKPANGDVVAVMFM
jgi:hypothetical protein